MKYLFFICLCVLSLNAISQHHQKIEGKIIDSKTRKPVPFASIGIKQLGIGTICDENGNFQFKFPIGSASEFICINAIGYEPYCRTANDIRQNGIIIKVNQANLELQQVQIQALSPRNLVLEAIRHIPDNYPQNPVYYTLYMRGSEIMNNQPTYMIESVISIYRDYKKNDQQFALHKSRGLVTQNQYAEKLNTKRVGIYLPVYVDDITSYPPYLHKGRSKKYSYSFGEQAVIASDTVLEISFQPAAKKNGQIPAGFEGSLFIDPKSFAVVRLESQLNQAALDKENRSLLMAAVSKIEGGYLLLKREHKQLNYQNYGGRWYLSNAKRETHHELGEKGSSVVERSQYTTQIVVTSVKTENVQEIPEGQQVKPGYSYYSTSPKDFTEAFWQDYNTIPVPAVFAKNITPENYDAINSSSESTPLKDSTQHESGAQLIGGSETFRNLLLSELRLSEEAYKNNLNGVVQVSLTILPDGSVSDLKVINPLGYGIDEEVIRVLKLTKWKPAHKNGENLRSNLTLKVSIKDFRD